MSLELLNNPGIGQQVLGGVSVQESEFLDGKASLTSALSNF